ncbi:MAG TPA: hypothetical protein VMD91_07920 [Candidatus Sulfotelmatobacter sp.]|nr:hypothetical protein [Candidatus Sulfotelmatobacter sp.]
MNLRAACRALGLTLIGTAAISFATDLALSADAPPTPTPSPSPSASAKPAAHGGPVAIGVTGNLNLGQQVNSGLAGAQESSTGDAGAVIDLRRSTPTTSTDVQIPAVIGAGSGISQATAEYDTPRESLLYGPQQVGGLGLVPAGSTTRGPALLLPRRHGDVTFYAGALEGTPSYLVKGVRLRSIGTAGYATLAAYDATTADGGRVDGVLAGFATRPGRVSAQLELGFEKNQGLGDGLDGIRIPDGTGFAMEGRVDDGGSHNYWSLDLRDLSPNYVSLGGVSQDDRYAALSYRTSFTGGSMTATVERDRTGGIGGVDDTQQTSVSLQEPFAKSGSAMLSLQNQSSLDAGSGKTWSGDATLDLTLPVHSSTFNGGITASRTTATIGGTVGSVSYDLGFAHAFPAFALQALASVDRETSLAGPDLATTASLGVSRTHGKTALSVTFQGERQFTPESAAAIFGPTITVTRRISPSVSLSVDAILQQRHDPLQPATNGRTTQFGFSLGAPFAFGNGIVTGRADPHLPGAIVGVVQTAVSSSPLFAPQNGAPTIGAANVAVVLDGQQTVRTDVQGRFAFRFVTAGVHQITIDPASLPRGEQAASPITTISLAGGQQAQLVLGIGAYGSIIGTVAAGTTPIPGVVVLLDGSARATSDAHGQFAFGALSAGAHTVAVVPESFPATYGGVDNPKQSVNVIIGDISHVAFTAAPLASVGGKVVFDHEHGDGGVENAYVVAEPGEHAGITDADGSFLLDNLPPGSYTLSVDPETLSAGLGVVSDAQVPVTLAGGAHLDGIVFTVGEGDKGVVFTFKGNDTSVVTVRALVKRLPPGGTTSIAVTTTQPADKVVAQPFGASVPLTYHSATHTWTGTIHVPATARAGKATVVVEASGKVGGTGEIEITVDPALPIASFALSPPNPQKGQYVHVRAHLLVDAHAGDTIVWQDGSATKLPNPRSGRYFEFDVKVTSLPFTGTLETSDGGHLPITLVK